jgi:MoaA/NifB/PqqE/SkfB family radical SAM enzyme
MHAPEAHRRSAPITPSDVDGVLSFLWLELTNRCNLKCVHCYTESGPTTGDRDVLTREDYEDLMAQARALGCDKIQLIGGEPQLNRSFGHILRATKDLGFEFVEVFSNLTKLDDDTLAFSVDNGVHFATSVYSDKPEIHDRVTQVRGSHQRTLRNLKRLVDAGVTTRAAVIAIDDDDANLVRTRDYLTELGTDALANRSSTLREFGRGQNLLGRTASMSALCGNCWRGSLAIAPDGQAYTCIMARDWPVGDVTRQPLSEIVHGQELVRVREEIYEVTRAHLAACSPYCYQTCQPDLSCPCEPLMCPKSCTPWGKPPEVLDE